MNKRSVYGNDMSRCSVFSDGEKIRYDKFVRFLILEIFWTYLIK